jgi:hypothetical protein
MKRTLAVVLALVAVLAVVGVSVATMNRTVSVETGVRYVCTYGHPIGSDVQTLQVKPADARKYHVETKTITCEKHRRAEALYAAAQAALGKGDVKTAESKLTELAKTVAGFKQTDRELADIRAGRKPKPDLSSNNPPPSPSTNTPGAGTPPSKDPTQNPPGDTTQGGGMDPWRDMVPDDLAGFRAEAVSAEELSLSRDYVPGDKSRYDQLVIQVQRYSTPKEAQQAIAAQIAPAYPASKRDAKVGGLSGYFGVNGQKFSVLSLTSGEVVVSLELHATGASPAGSYNDLKRIAEEVLD